MKNLRIFCIKQCYQWNYFLGTSLNLNFSNPQCNHTLGLSILYSQTWRFKKLLHHIRYPSKYDITNKQLKICDKTKSKLLIARTEISVQFSQLNMCRLYNVKYQNQTLTIYKHSSHSSKKSGKCLGKFDRHVNLFMLSALFIEF